MHPPQGHTLHRPGRSLGTAQDAVLTFYRITMPCAATAPASMSRLFESPDDGGCIDHSAMGSERIRIRPASNTTTLPSSSAFETRDTFSSSSEIC